MASFWRLALDRIYDAALVPSYCAPGFNLRRQMWNDPDLSVDMTGHVCIVTGANSGIGRATAEQLIHRGADVVMVCRNPERGQVARQELRSLAKPEQTVELELCDLSEITQVDALATRVLSKYDRIDVLINNAGVMLHSREETSDGLEKGFSTNVLSGFLLTWRLKKRLAEQAHARVIHVTSGGMYTQRLRVDDLQSQSRSYDGVKAYAQHKRAQVILNELWVQHLPAHVTTNCMHPGWAATPGVSRSLPRFNQLLSGVLRDSEQGADTAVYLAVSPEVRAATGGLYFDRQIRSAHVLPTTRSTDDERAALWRRCCELARV